MSKIFLHGPSGSGKTTVGRVLAENLSLPFIDLDEEIETGAGMMIPEIFAARGEAAFRQMETDALHEACRTPGEGVVSLGGGALLAEGNRQMAEAAGRVLCLTADRDTLQARLAGDAARPLLAGGLDDYLARRTPHYAAFDLQLATTGLSPDQAAWQAQILLGAFRLPPACDVRVRRGGLDALGEMIKQRGLQPPVGLVTDANVEPYAQRVAASLRGSGFPVRVIIIPPGEANKSLATVNFLWEEFLAGGLERGSTVVAVGGGVAGDAAGFAAATYLRGVAWVAVPTTLLAMVDASLGGKTGIDLRAGKNLAGAFHAPRLVAADPDALATLPEREARSGLAEVVKAGVIGDAGLFALARDFRSLEEPKALDFGSLVARAMAVKARIVAEDPLEQGRRAALNFGHTVGHAVEHVSGFALSHGEAVAIGMVAEARLAARLGIAAAGLAGEIEACLRGLGLPVEVPAGMGRETILAAMALDKKKAGGRVKFALPVKIGSVVTGVIVDKLDIIFD
jgi:3-dehydroquinate synthase